MSIAPTNSPTTYPPLVIDAGVKTSRPLRVCVASFDFVGPVKNGGVGTAFTSLAEALARAGHEVTCLFLAGRWCENRTLEHWIEDYRKKGIQFVPLPESGLRYEAAWHITKAYEGYLWLKEQNFDVVHFSEWKGPGYFSLLAKRQGLAFAQTLLCVHTHGPTLWHKLSNGEYVTQVDDVQMDYLECRSVQLAEVLVSPSQYLLRWMLERNWILPEKTFVQPYVRPATARAPLPDAGRCHQIRELVFFGRLEVRKGLVLFCDALELLKDDPQLRHVAITFLGKVDKISGRDSAEYLTERARSWPWTCRLVSDRDQAGAMDYLQGAGRLAVLPSLVDNLPNTVLECLGAQVPFIASNAGGIPEMIAAADLEATCFPLQPRAFADKLRSVLRHGIRPATPAWDARENETAWVKWHESQFAAQSLALPAVSLELMVSQPLVSVCMSHWNRPHYLRQALASIEAMDYPNYEIVLVDDGSTQPEALKLIEELTPQFARRGWQLLRNSENRFPGAARNLAARHARGEYILFMDDDNCAKPHELSTFMKAARRTGADILTCCLDTFTGAEAPHGRLTPRSRWIFVGDDAATGAIRNCFGDTNSLMRREVFLKIGGFHEDWGVGHEDWEFFAKAVLAGYKLEVVPEALAWYRLNATEQTVNRKTPIHRNHMANIRPYLAAVPPCLKNLVYLAQGQDLQLAQPGRDGGEAAAQIAHLKHSLRWRGLFEAARELHAGRQQAAASKLLKSALTAASETKQPLIMLEGLLAVGTEMRATDEPDARQVLQLAVKLARSLKRTADADLASSLLASPINAKTKAGKAVPARGNPARIAPATAVPSRVSIVIPVFNNLPLTQRCLTSLAAISTSVPHEIIVVDNASTDGTAEFLASTAATAGIRVVTHARNEGFANACNRGAQAATSPMVLFLNNDTQVTAGWLEALVTAVQRPGVGVAGARLLYADGTIQHAGIEFINGVPDHPHRRAPGNAPVANQFRELDMVTGACFMARRDLFLQLGGFDETYRNGVEDIDLCLRVRAAGFKVVYEPGSVVYHLEGQSAGRFDHVRENLALFFQRWGKSFNPQWRFIAPPVPQFMPASRSILPTVSPAPAAAARQPVTVAWEGSFLDFGSLSHVNRELTRALAGAENVVLHRVNTPALPAGSVPPPALQPLADTLAAQAPAQTQVTIRHAWPPDWRRPAAGKLVVIQPWEFGSLPQDWVKWSRHVDEFWLPSEYVRRVYLKSGVDAAKVFVVPNGVDAEQFQPQAAPMKLATTKKFKFLFVGGTIGRKGPDLLLQAYFNKFTAADDVCLVLKDFGGGSVYAGQTMETQIRALQARPDAPEILYLNEELPPGLLPGLYTACDCFVLPYRGEGFGLPVLEAMACGLPVIVTAGGATDDFVRDEFAYRIPAAKRELGHEVSGLKLAGAGWLLEPRLDVLGEQMRHVFSQPGEARERGRLASRHAHQNFSWKNAAVTAARRLHTLAGKPGTAAAEGVALPASIKPAAVADVGRLNEARALLDQKNLPAAWAMTHTCIARRPFHPEAFLLLAEIAVAAGAGKVAKQYAQHARDLAPAWGPVKQFLCKPIKGDAKPDWLNASPGLAAPPAPRLSVCLIVKNEERFLVQCLKSVRGLATQLIVVDTGSTDRTVEIAREFGAEIHTFPWCDDFAAARNAALEHATGDWVLMLDADEELPAAQHVRLKADMKSATTIALRLPLVNAGQENEGRSFVPRLFRNAPGACFTGRIHEQVFSSLLELGKKWGLKIGLGSAELRHHGYSQELLRDRNKIERNLKLLRAALEETPHDVNLVMNLGLELARSDDLAGGLEKYRAAYDLMSAQAPADLVPELREVLLTQYTSQLYKAHDHATVVRVLNSPLAQRGGLTASLHLALGLAHHELKQFAEAAEQICQCLAKRRQPVLTPINTDILTAMPQHCLALCHLKLGNPAAAERAFLAAIGETGHVDKAQLDYAKFLRDANRELDALHQLHRLITAFPRHGAAWCLGGEIALGRANFLEFALDWTAEAFKALPEDPVIATQRATALMLGGRALDAVPLWEKLWCCEPQPRTLAALILCELTAGLPLHTPNTGADEPSSGVAFVEWYQKLIAMRAKPLLEQINGRLESLAGTLPTAAEMLQNALSAAETPLAAG